MADAEHQGNSNVVDASLVDDGEDGHCSAHLSVGESSPDLVLPLDALASTLLVPESKGQVDVPTCAWETIDQCITEAAARLAFESANAAARGNRKVITPEDVNRAIESLHQKDPDLGMVLKDMNVIVTRCNRATAVRRRRERRLRKERAAAEKKAKKQEDLEASAAKEGLSGRRSRK